MEVKFLDYTDKKESDIGLIIDIIRNEYSYNSYKAILLLRGSNEKGKLFKNCFDDLTNMLEHLNIDSKLIIAFIIFFLNNDLTLSLLIREITSLLRNKYPKSIIKIEDAIKEKMTPFVFIKKFVEIKDKIDNYTKLIWDDKKKIFKINNSSIDEILKDINQDEKTKTIKNKKKPNNQIDERINNAPINEEIISNELEEKNQNLQIELLKCRQTLQEKIFI